jgi:hypothetical protein
VRISFIYVHPLPRLENGVEAEHLKNVPVRVSIQPSRLTAQNLVVPLLETVLETDSESLSYFEEF